MRPLSSTHTYVCKHLRTRCSSGARGASCLGQLQPSCYHCPAHTRMQAKAFTATKGCYPGMCKRPAVPAVGSCRPAGVIILQRSSTCVRKQKPSLQPKAAILVCARGQLQPAVASCSHNAATVKHTCMQAKAVAALQGFHPDMCHEPRQPRLRPINIKVT